MGRGERHVYKTGKMRMVSGGSELFAETSDRLFGIFPASEGGEAEVSLAAAAETGAGGTDDLQLFEQIVKKLRGSGAR